MFFSRKKTLSTEELLRFLDALIEANASSDARVTDHLNYIHSKYRTLDKVPYHEAIKLIELNNSSRSQEIENSSPRSEESN